MSLPEISRRCLSCGAAVRAGARFCPQCGKSVNDESPVAQAAEGFGGASGNGDAAGGANESAAPTTRDTEAPHGWATPAREFSTFAGDLDFDKSGEEKNVVRAASDEAAASARAPDAGFDPAKTTPIIRPPETVGMNSAAGAAADLVETDASADDRRGRAAGVREGTRTRAQRFGDDARVALEERPDDGGLWFVVAAAVLFVTFLVFLFLSTTVLR
ncbi:MAG TPA: zinc ribbon domain-containing protein [Pyrinomonadaceae bacterium]|nr:zinc ribbon domain-containing protein [Pyrinomonadaceae bacterium]